MCGLFFRFRRFFDRLFHVICKNYDIETYSGLLGTSVKLFDNVDEQCVE